MLNRCSDVMGEGAFMGKDSEVQVFLSQSDCKMVGLYAQRAPPYA